MPLHDEQQVISSDAGVRNEDAGVRNEDAGVRNEDAPVRRWREIVIAALSFLAFITLMTVVIDRLGVSRLQEAVLTAGPLAPLLYISIKTLTYIFAPLTSGPIQLSAGVLFGLWEGVLLTLIGEVLGGSISFLLARRFGRPVVARFVGQEGMLRVDSFYQTHMGGWQSLAVARVVMFSFWDFLSYAAGLSPVRFRTYVLISVVLGFLPTFVFVYLGTMLAMDSQALLFAYALVALMILLPILLRRPLSRWLSQRRAGQAGAGTPQDWAEGS